jgi:tRNA dimethylallyltransferase
LNQNLLFICGPTGIGKSSLALRLAKRINGVIINSDSMQIYSNLEILTARPSKEDCQIVKHELYGYVDGSKRYNVAKWCNDILKIVNINKKNKTPSIIVGGTGMYVNSLLNGLIDLPPILERFKDESKHLLESDGLDNFVKLIKDIDSEALSNISQNDSFRLRRIWEVYKSTGVTFTEWKKRKNKKFLINTNYNLYLFNPDREKIYQNVNLRFIKMIEGGAIEEVEKLKSLNLDRSLPIMRAHGVPEILNYLDKQESLDTCIDRGQQVTRNYVKRQLTWWRSSSLNFHQTFNQFPKDIDENLIKI